MSILAQVPARAGSKRVPDNNIKRLGGLPLMACSVRAALEGRGPSDVVVSANNTDIAEVARQYGARLLGLRLNELSTKITTSMAVGLHAPQPQKSGQGDVDVLFLPGATSHFAASSRRSMVQRYLCRVGLPSSSWVKPGVSHPARCFRYYCAQGMENLSRIGVHQPALPGPGVGMDSQRCYVTSFNKPPAGNT